MSVRQRTWTTSSGEVRTAWVADYHDQGGKRRHKTFRLKKDALSFVQNASVEVRAGLHVADSASITIGTAGQNWLASGDAAGLEVTTLAQRRQHLDLHILPFIGATLLSRLSVPAVRAFEDRLRVEGRSPAMIKKIIVSLGSIFADAQERGHVMRNPIRDMRGGRSGADLRVEKRRKGKLKVGEDIPAPNEARALIEAADGRWRPFFVTAIFSGLRSSELRGLRWQDVDLDRREIRVHQRADKFGQIGRPKTEAGERAIPVPPLVVKELREWKVACPRRRKEPINGTDQRATELHFVFPNGRGGVENHANIINRGWHPLQIRAGIVVSSTHDDAETRPKYSGLHSIRHFYASWLINRREDGGLNLPAKAVQERLGHSSITMTLDTYGHLFPRGNDAEELAAAEAALLGKVAT